MKRYFKNLLLALFGKDPFREELDSLKEKYDKAAKNTAALTDMYYTLVEKMSGTEKQVSGCQNLIENLRVRLSEKDAGMEAAGQEFRDRMERMKADYQRRIDEYNRKIEELQNKD